MSLTYNYLNLPVTANKPGTSLSYTYDATGKKLAKNSNGSIRNYINGIEYNDNTIDVIHTEEGLAQNNGGTYTYRYKLSDHLGNVRYTFDIYNGAVRRLQSDDYYAFGKRRSVSPVSTDNKYLYNGKEVQDELGDQYDYGARFYYPVVGRFSTIDPMSEVSRRFSTYSYAVDNPVRFIDVDGMYAEEGPGPKPKYKISRPEYNTKGDQAGYIRNASESQKRTFSGFMLDFSSDIATGLGINALDNLFFSGEKITLGKAGLAAVAVVQGMEAIDGAGGAGRGRVSEGTGFGPEVEPMRQHGPYTKRDLARAQEGKGPLDFSPRTNKAGKEMPLELHHADQMPGSAIHEVKPGHPSYVPHPNKFNQGVTMKMRIEDSQLHWYMRGKEMGNK